MTWGGGYSIVQQFDLPGKTVKEKKMYFIDPGLVRPASYRGVMPKSGKAGNADGIKEEGNGQRKNGC